MKQLILITLAVISIFFAIGSVGAYDDNTIGFGQLMLQVGIAVVVEWFSLKALNE